MFTYMFAVVICLYILEECNWDFWPRTTVDLNVWYSASEGINWMKVSVAILVTQLKLQY